MDLVSFVPGIGPTAAFTPGSGTSSPLNVSHTGLTNGTSPSTASKNQAEVYNRLLLQVASVVVKSGLTVDNTNWAQLGDAVAQMITTALAGSGFVSSSTYNADFASTQASNGQQRIKGGIIFQWMTGAHSAGNVQYNWTFPFPSACYCVVVSSRDQANIIAPDSFSTAGVVLNQSSTTNFFAFAIGK